MTEPTIELLTPGLPFGCDVGSIGMCSVVLVEGPDSAGRPTRIVVDTGHAGRRQHIWKALRQRGLTVDDIDIVVLTHGHWDHIQNVDAFPRARVLLHGDELAYLRSPSAGDWATPAWTAALLDGLDVSTTGEGDELIPGVAVLDLPGHTAGTIGVLVESPTGRAVIPGDALPRSAVVANGQHPLVFWDVDQADRSLRRVLELADVVYPGHDRPFRLDEAGAAEYVGQPPSVTLTGLDVHAEGLQVVPSVPLGRTVLPKDP